MKPIVDILTQVPSLLWWSAALYAVSVAIFMILENRSPEKTFAWLLLFFSLPLVGVIIYFMFGRDHRAFSRQDRLLRQELSRHLRSRPHIAEFLAEQPKAIEALKKNKPLVYDRALELMRRNVQTPLFLYNSLEILQDATEKYPRLCEDLQAAQHSIHMEYFEWASDDVMQTFKKILLERAKAGVQVRVLYDPIGSLLMLKRRYVQEMNAGGVKMLPWSSLLAIHTISYRSHRKIVVIDGKIGYTGGLNMSEEYVKGPHSGHFTGWRDTHVRVTGQVVIGLQANFAVQWFNTTKEDLVDLDYYPPITEKHGYLPLQIVNSGPDAEWKAIRSLYFALITAAQKYVYIQSPFFILDEGLTEAIAGAARSGVDVKIMLAPRGPSPQFPYWAGLTYAENVAKAGAKVYFYHGKYFHPKTISVDSVICSIGSANMDIRSFSINYESNLIIYDEKVTRELEADFDNDLQQCTEFTFRAYKRTNMLKRARNSLFRLGSPLL